MGGHRRAALTQRSKGQRSKGTQTSGTPVTTEPPSTHLPASDCQASNRGLRTEKRPPARPSQRPREDGDVVAPDRIKLIDIRLRSLDKMESSHTRLYRLGSPGIHGNLSTCRQTEEGGSLSRGSKLRFAQKHLPTGLHFATLIGVSCVAHMGGALNMLLQAVSLFQGTPPPNLATPLCSLLLPLEHDTTTPTHFRA